MAAAAITLSGTIFLVDSIQRIATKGTGTTIFYGSPRGGGSTLLQTDVTESLVTVVTALGDAVIPLTVVTNGVGVVNYFPLNAIKGIRASVASPINAAVLIGAPSGNGASIGEVFVTETAAQVTELLNDNTISGSKYLAVTWAATHTIDLEPYINSTEKLFINFVGTTQATTAITFTGVIPPKFTIQMFFNANTTPTVTLNAANVICVAGAIGPWTNSKALVGPANLYQLEAIGDNVTDEIPVLATRPTFA